MRLPPGSLAYPKHNIPCNATMDKIAAWYGLKSGEDDDNNPAVFLIAPVSIGDSIPVYGTYKTTPGTSDQNIKGDRVAV